MLWVVAVVVLGEIVVFAQLMLSFQKRGSRLRIARAPILKRIERHRQALVELAEKVQTRTTESLGQVDETIADFTRSAGHAANLVAELDNEAHERAQELGLKEDDEEDEDDDDDEIVEESEGGDDFNPMKVEKDKGFDAFETVRLIRGDLEDIYEYIESLRHDKDIVSNMAQRMAASNGKPKG